MPDCNTSNTDCQPAGSNPVNPCSPCFEVTPANFQDVLAELARQVCAQGNQLKAHNQRLDKVLNKFLRLQATIDRLPSLDEDSAFNPCGNLDGSTEAEAILVCNEGGQKTFIAPEDCGHIAAKDGKWLISGPRIHWLDAKHTLTIGTNSNLPEYEEALADSCGLTAIIEGGSSVVGNSASSGTRNYLANDLLFMRLVIFAGITDVKYNQIMVPLEENQIIITQAGANTGSPSYSFGASLLGYIRH